MCARWQAQRSVTLWSTAAARVRNISCSHDTTRSVEKRQRVETSADVCCVCFAETGTVELFCLQTLQGFCIFCLHYVRLQGDCRDLTVTSESLIVLLQL